MRNAEGFIVNSIEVPVDTRPTYPDGKKAKVYVSI